MSRKVVFAVDPAQVRNLTAFMDNPMDLFDPAKCEIVTDITRLQELAQLNEISTLIIGAVDGDRGRRDLMHPFHDDEVAVIKEVMKNGGKVIGVAHKYVDRDLKVTDFLNIQAGKKLVSEALSRLSQEMQV